MPKITFKSAQEFINAANIIHENKYSYHNFVYNHLESKSYITCPNHGDFLQKPVNHLKRKQGCPVCSGKIKKTQEQFLSECLAIHGNLYDYSNSLYVNYLTNVEISCKIHGKFYQSPAGHISQKQGCPKCCGTLRGNTLDFISRSRAVHGDLYDYSKVKYVNCKDKVIITCQFHGDFLQSPIMHTNKGTGCRLCNVTGGYSHKWFKEHPENTFLPAIIYLVKISNATQSCYKIGITKKSVDNRFNATKNMGLVVETIKIFNTTLYKAFETEQRILRSVLYLLEKPNNLDIRGGETECFIANDVELENIIQKIQSFL